ncbi:MAG: metallophosphoesterase [Lachnospiraceae bacterium]|nr:metallophosphoesterase [Lachnospiraceae bacterium]
MWYFIFGLLLLLVIYGVCVIVRDMNRFVIRPYEVRSEKIKKKYTFVMLSDLHNKSYGKNNEKLVRAIRECRPDCVMTAGDLYTSKAGSGFDNAIALLKALSEQFPVYIANGNHENKTRINPDIFGTMYEDYTAELRRCGLQPLVNEHVIVPEANLDICGLTIGQEYFRHFKKREMPDGYLRSLAGKANENRFQILLAHNPLYFPEYAKWGADLVLSGHVHGGIVKLPVLGGVISPAVTLFPKYDGGRFERDGSVMILGRGLGTHTLPVRMWNPGEVVVVTLLPPCTS